MAITSVVCAWARCSRMVDAVVMPGEQARTQCPARGKAILSMPSSCFPHVQPACLIRSFKTCRLWGAGARTHNTHKLAEPASQPTQDAATLDLTPIDVTSRQKAYGSGRKNGSAARGHHRASASAGAGHSRQSTSTHSSQLSTR